MSHKQWWLGLPTWLKLVYALAAIPAWLFIVYSILTNQSEGVGAIVAFLIFAAATLLFLVFDRRPGVAVWKDNAVSIEDGDGVGGD